MNNAEFDDVNPEKTLAAKFERNGHHLATKIERVIIPAKISSPITLLQVSDYAFAPTTPADFLPSIGRWISVGGIVMVASFGSAIALSTILKYKVTVQAPRHYSPRRRTPAGAIDDRRFGDEYLRAGKSNRQQGRSDRHYQRFAPGK